MKEAANCGRDANMQNQDIVALLRADIDRIGGVYEWAKNKYRSKLDSRKQGSFRSAIAACEHRQDA